MEAFERLFRDAPDRKLCRVNALAFAAAGGLDEEETIAGSCRPRR
ncbi:Adenylate cyclase [Sinorhizobium sojae CCBAU 05684]|uniref:Adenylate cyclase n=1 Tax=Sinorhizobium sojae CCBAU 05684 TaxID=716928 RepID=A0A249PC93_9HYPH|nr:Adenylate cyclase [Sinorhizobium sojae CCBAU 05684]